MSTIFSKDGIATTQITRFDGGIVNDPRNPKESIARIISNFDAITSANKLIPYRSSEAGDTNANATRISNYCIARRDGTTYSLYGLGRTSAASVLAEIYYKNLTTSSANDLDDSDWTETANNVSASGSQDYNLFAYYRKSGMIYFAKAGTTICAYDPTGATALAEGGSGESVTIAYTYIGQGITHSKDGIFYVPVYNNAGAAGAKSFIISKNGTGAWNTSALALPDHLIPTSISESGNFLAIACAPASGVGNSVVYLWDRDSTLVSESIDWGTGSLVIIEEIDGELVGISQKGGTGTSFSGIPHGTSSHRDKVIFRRLVGIKAKKFLEIQANHAGSSNTTKIPLYKQTVDNRLLFQMFIELNGSVRDGIWSIGRSGPNEEFALIHERTSNNNTALVTGDIPNGFFLIGDYLFQSYLVNATSIFNITKTDDGSTFSHNSVYETKTYDAGDASFYKDLLEVVVQTEYMPAAGQITLAYQVDEDIGTSTWTTIFTNSTNNSISNTANNIESSGVQLPRAYKQIAFRILSTGGTEVTGLLFREQIIGRKYIAD